MTTSSTLRPLLQNFSGKSRTDFANFEKFHEKIQNRLEVTWGGPVRYFLYIGISFYFKPFNNMKQLNVKAHKSLKNNVFITAYHLVKHFPIVYFD